jgi:cytochrome c oxidase cbb3-type subunit 3
MRWRTPLIVGFALAACGGAEPERARSTDVPAAVRGAPAAGSGLLALEVTTLTPGRDTALTRLRNPYEGDDDAIAEGEMFFNNFNCSGCHAALGGGGMGPPLSDTLWIYGGEPGNVYLSILQGRPNGMPAWHQLPPEVIWKLVAYIHSLPERAAQVSTAPRP